MQGSFRHGIGRLGMTGDMVCHVFCSFFLFGG
jgi:hypothetical protein